MNLESTANGATAKLGTRIRLARRAIGLSQAGFAAKIGITPSAVAQWESPRGTRPDLDRLLTIAAMASVSLDWLLTGKEARKSALLPPDGEVPAAVPGAFAHTVQEESLLIGFRELRPKARDVLMMLTRELALPVSPRKRQRR